MGLAKKKTPCLSGKHTCGALDEDDAYAFHPEVRANSTVEIKPICISERSFLEAYLEPKNQANADKLDMYLLKEIKGKRAPKFDFEGNEGWKVVGYKMKPNKKHGFLRLSTSKKPGCYLWAVTCKKGATCDFEYDFFHSSYQ